MLLSMLIHVCVFVYERRMQSCINGGCVFFFYCICWVWTLGWHSKESLRVWLAASSQPSWISLNCSCKLPTAQRVTSGLFPWYKVCSIFLSLYWLGLLWFHQRATQVIALTAAQSLMNSLIWGRNVLLTKTAFRLN